MSLQLHDLLLRLANYDDSTFRFVENKTFVSSARFMFAVCVAYLLGIFGLQRIMSKREGFSIQYIVGIHNGFLSLVSFVLMVLIADNIFLKIRNNGLHWAVCSESSVVGSLEFYCYLNYLVKYYEFLDTVFLVLKKKRHSFFAYLSSYNDIDINSCPIRREGCCAMGSHCYKSFCSCFDVLLLHACNIWCECLVEKIFNFFANNSICNRLNFLLLCYNLWVCPKIQKMAVQVMSG